MVGFIIRALKEDPLPTGMFDVYSSSIIQLIDLLLLFELGSINLILIVLISANVTYRSVTVDVMNATLDAFN